jgi:membrane protein implicated in regulation of membrane protease activity
MKDFLEKNFLLISYTYLFSLAFATLLLIYFINPWCILAFVSGFVIYLAICLRPLFQKKKDKGIHPLFLFKKPLVYPEFIEGLGSFY